MEPQTSSFPEIAVYGDHYALTTAIIEALPDLFELGPSQQEGRDKMAGFINRYVANLMKEHPDENEDTAYLQQMIDAGFTGQVFIALYALCAEEFKEPSKTQVCFKESVRP